MKKKIQIAPLAVVVAFTAVILWQGCANTVGPQQQQLQKIVFPATNVSYSQQVQPMFNLACAFSGCHDDVKQAGGLSLTSWTNTCFSPNAPGVVVPKNPQQSILCEVLEGRTGHTGGLLDTIQNHVKGVHQWVLEGAKDN